MKPILLLLVFLCLLGGCIYQSITVDRDYKFVISSVKDDDYMAEDEIYAKWFDGSNSTSNFCIRADVYGDIGCYVINVSRQDMIIHRDDLAYVIMYQGVDGSRHYFEHKRMSKDTIGTIEVLWPEPEELIGVIIARGAHFRYWIPIPKDCAKILAVSVAIEHTTFPKISKCKNTNDLSEVFKENIEYVRVEYF
ncbi:MAG: hypothetical protein IKR18_10755 [Bacteroidaceae bacterium]|nr:hypothetical protein [Bacteroidaceae bacterium]